MADPDIDAPTDPTPRSTTASTSTTASASAIAAASTSPSGSGALDVLLLTSALWFLAKLLRYAFPPLFDTLRATHGVSNGVLGAAFTAMMLAYAAMQYPSGALADHLGPVRVVVGGAAVAAIGALLLGAGVVGVLGVAGLVAAMVLVGVGTGAHKTVAVALLARTHPGRRGGALGAMDTFGTFGGVVAPLAVVAVLASDRPWTLFFLAGGAVGLALAVAFALRVPSRLPSAGASARTTDSPGDDATAAGHLDTLRATVALAFATPRLRAFVLVTVLFSFAYNGVVAFLPTYLGALPGVTGAQAGLVYGGFFLVSLVQPVSGAAADRWGTVPVVAATLALAASGLLVLLVATTPAVAVAAVLALGLGSHAFRPVRGSHLVDLAPPDATGGLLGVVRTALMGAGALAPVCVGVVADAAGQRASFALPTVALAAAALGGLWLVATE
ncbi:MAG: MFS transporter [Halobacteriaceae archaeon]